MKYDVDPWWITINQRTGFFWVEIGDVWTIWRRLGRWRLEDEWVLSIGEKEKQEEEIPGQISWYLTLASSFIYNTTSNMPQPPKAVVTNGCMLVKQDRFILTVFKVRSPGTGFEGGKQGSFLACSQFLVLS